MVWTAGNVDVTIFDGNEVFAWGEGRVAEFVALVNLATTEGTLGGTFDEHGQEAGSSSCSSHHKLVLYAWFKKSKTEDIKKKFMSADLIISSDSYQTGT